MLSISSHARCVPVQYEFYYSTRGDETVLVREPIEQPPRCQPRCPQHCEATTVSVSMNVSPPTEPRDRHREDAEHKRRSLKKKKKRSSRHKKKKKGHHRSSRQSSRQCKQSISSTEASERKTANDTSSKILKPRPTALGLQTTTTATRLRFGSASPRGYTAAQTLRKKAVLVPARLRRTGMFLLPMERTATRLRLRLRLQGTPRSRKGVRPIRNLSSACSRVRIGFNK
ncbi:hypothetical protein J3F84DRAFT_354169 [Trichoderma pleuroticola]